MLPNCPQYLIAAFAVLRHGAIVVNINPTYTARELLTVANDSGMRFLVTLDVLAPLALGIRNDSRLEHIVITSLAEYSAAGGAPPKVDGTLRLSDLLDDVPQPRHVRVPIDADDLAVLQYTGGTTGAPKGAMLTHANIFANVVQTEAFMYRTRERGAARYLMVIPYFHIYGFTVGMMKGTWVGALQILIPKYDVEQVLAALRDHPADLLPRRADDLRVAADPSAREGVRPRPGADLQQRGGALPGRSDRAVRADLRAHAQRRLRTVGSLAGHPHDRRSWPPASPARSACRCRTPT